MARKLMQFTRIEQKMPEKRTAQTRAKDFGEIYAGFAPEQAATQASRCSQCGIPFCQVHCPLQNNIPDWLKLTAEGRLEEAYTISSATNTFPEICGRICPQDRLCEGNCVIEQSGHGTVTIGSVEKYITDTAWEQGWVKPAAPAQERQESVGIIGAGPGGLAAADLLRRAGVQVTVYDRYDRGGGLMTYGIPGFKLEKEVVMRRMKQLEDGGVRFVYNCNVGEDMSFEDIRDQHDAVIIATGVYKSRDLRGPGSGAKGIVRAIDYLTASNRAANFGDSVPEYESGELNANGKRVVVIGGGDTAMDCVRTAIRQGAESVKCLYRRDRTNMPGSQREVANAEEEGVQFEWLTAPKGFSGDPVTGVMVQKMRLGLPDATGRQSPEIIEGSDYEEPADLVIKALGFEPEELPTLWGAPELEVTRWGTVKAEFTSGRTALPGVYAVGDIVRGASLVVWAIRDGRDCAEHVLQDFNKTAAVAAE